MCFNLLQVISFDIIKEVSKTKTLTLLIKDALKAFDDFKNKQQKCMKWVFLICKSIYILKVYSIQYTLR